MSTVPAGRKSLLRRLAKAVASRLPKEAEQPLIKLGSRVPGLRSIAPFDHQYWIRNQYSRFAQDQRKSIFMSIARFAHINRPLNGYYMEFGCHGANTMRHAWDCFRWQFDWQFLAFDSFQGLPQMEDFDRSSIFVPGNLSTSEASFIDIVVRHGLPRERLRTVKGFYSDSLTPALRSELEPTKAAVIYIDSDLYESAVTVLDFTKSFLQIGTIVVFDDWNCYHARPDMGERRAWREFLERNSHLQFVDFVSTAEAMSFICVACPKDD